MESKKGGASIDDLFGRKETNKPSSGSSYFNSVFATSPNSTMGKEAIHGKQRGESHAGNGYAYNSDVKSQGSPTKKQTVYTKDGKSYTSNESAESPYFGSSVHYGGRDFYGGSPPKHAVETSKNYKDDNQDGSVATRGDWWQGSLYY